MNAVIVFCTCANEQEAERLSESIVQARLAACVNVLPRIRSVYRWKGAVEKGEEWLLLIKSSAELFPALENFIRENHSYEVPEIIGLPVSFGYSAYLDWISGSLQLEE